MCMYVHYGVECVFVYFVYKINTLYNYILHAYIRKLSDTLVC